MKKLIPINLLMITVFICANLFTTLAYSQENSTEIYTTVEKQPQFPGGTDALMKYLNKSIQYPADAIEKGIQGSVYITFVVEADGSLSNTKVLRGIGGGCDEEAIRVIKNMPKWEPGMQKGKPVRVQFNIPIRFTLLDTK